MLVKQVLIVDDSKVAYHKLRSMFSERGIKAEWANSGEAGLEALKQHTPDMILLDVMLPGMDGYETARAITKSMANKPPPIIICSSSPAENQAPPDLRSVTAYLIKPCTNRALDQALAKVNRILGYQSAEKIPPKTHRTDDLPLRFKKPPAAAPARSGAPAATPRSWTPPQPAGLGPAVVFSQAEPIAAQRLALASIPKPEPAMESPVRPDRSPASSQPMSDQSTPTATPFEDSKTTAASRPRADTELEQKLDAVGQQVGVMAGQLNAISQNLLNRPGSADIEHLRREYEALQQRFYAYQEQAQREYQALQQQTEREFQALRQHMQGQVQQLVEQKISEMLADSEFTKQLEAELINSLASRVKVTARQAAIDAVRPLMPATPPLNEPPAAPTAPALAVRKPWWQRRGRNTR